MCDFLIVRSDCAVMMCDVNSSGSNLVSHLAASNAAVPPAAVGSMSFFGCQQTPAQQSESFVLQEITRLLSEVPHDLRQNCLQELYQVLVLINDRNTHSNYFSRFRFA